MGVAQCRYGTCGCNVFFSNGGESPECEKSEECPACTLSIKQVVIGIAGIILFLLLLYVARMQSITSYNLRKSYYLNNGATPDQADALAGVGQGDTVYVHSY